MSFSVIFTIAIGLALDAFAVSVTNGICTDGFTKAHSARQGIYFGLFQFLMPLAGWILGSGVKSYVESFDHWIAFGLLLIIGVNMIVEARKSEDEPVCFVLTSKRLIVQAIATSIDAFAVGISIALLDVNVVYAAAVFGVVAFVFSFAGGLIGKKAGALFQQRAQIFGGIVLILIGLKILLEHMM